MAGLYAKIIVNPTRKSGYAYSVKLYLDSQCLSPEGGTFESLFVFNTVCVQRGWRLAPIADDTWLILQSS